MLWNATLATGIPTVDEQHQELFRQVDILMDHTKKDRIPDTLAFLDGYVVKHFATEQNMHARSGYPKAAAHKAIHDKFIAVFTEFKREYEQSGHNLTTLMKFNRMVMDWLKTHIMAEDKDFAVFYKSGQ